MSLVRFEGSGRVGSKDPEIQRDLDDTLNLNDRTLVAARQAATQAVLNELKLRQPTGDWSRQQLRRELERWRPSTSKRELPEFCESVAQELQRRIDRA